MATNTSIVVELQRLASESTTPLGDLLRKALIVATKLKIDDFRIWIQNELNGYPSDGELPDYRQLRGRPIAIIPGRGEVPIMFKDAALEDKRSIARIGAPIAEVDQLSKQKGLLYATPAPGVTADYHRSCGRSDFTPQIHVSPSGMAGIIDVVRNSVLDWALNLEQVGILGDGMSFSEDEKKKAAESPSIHIGSIGNFTGNVGSVTGHNIQIGDFSSINEQLKEKKISQSERNELETIMDAMKTAKPEEKQGLLQRGTAWVNKNKAALGTLATVIIEWFGQHHSQ